MKYIKHSDGTVELDGDPTEIAAYHHTMSTKKFPKRSSRGITRRAYSSNERTQILSLSNKGKTPAQVARYLWKHNLSPVKRTPAAITTEIARMFHDPDRR